TTLVPGNHDAYSEASAFERALEGPLRAYAATSAHGAIVDLDDSCVVAISTAMPQALTRSAGTMRSDALECLAGLARATRVRERAVIAAQHHPPLGHRLSVVNWVDGINRRQAFHGLLRD